LVDLKRLAELRIENDEKIAEEHKLLLPIKLVYYLAPSESEEGLNLGATV